MILVDVDEIRRVEAGASGAFGAFRLFFRLDRRKPGIRLAYSQGHAGDHQNTEHNARTELAEQGDHTHHQQPGDHASAFKILPVGKEAVSFSVKIKLALRSTVGQHVYKGGEEHRDQQHADYAQRRPAGSPEQNQCRPQEADCTGPVTITENARHKLAQANDDGSFIDKIADRRAAGQKKKDKRQRDTPRVVFCAGVFPVRLGLPFCGSRFGFRFFC